MTAYDDLLRAKALMDRHDGFHDSTGEYHPSLPEQVADYLDRTDATDKEFRARFERFGIFDEERKAATAVDVDALDAARAALAAVMPAHQSWCHAEAHADCCRADDCDCGVADSLDALLPVVDQIANQRAAAELRAAASDLHVQRFNADSDPEVRWPSGAPQAPDSFYAGILRARVALRAKATALDPS